MRPELHKLVEDTVRAHETWGLTWVDRDDDSPPPLTVLRAELVAALARVDEVRNHAHQWDEDDICVVCGADGRA